MKNATATKKTATKKTATKKTATKKTGRRSVPVGHDLDGILSAIARETLHIETLATRGSDSCDFHDVAVWRLKAALEAAFRAGVAVEFQWLAGGMKEGSMNRYTVDVVSCDVRRRRRTTRVLAASSQDARARALVKLFGRGANWAADSGLLGYGQVTRYDARVQASRCLTARVRVDVERGW